MQKQTMNFWVFMMYIILNNCKKLTFIYFFQESIQNSDWRTCFEEDLITKMDINRINGIFMSCQPPKFLELLLEKNGKFLAVKLIYLLFI